MKNITIAAIIITGAILAILSNNSAFALGIIGATTFLALAATKATR